MENNETPTSPETNTAPAKPAAALTWATMNSQQRLYLLGAAAALIAVIAGLWMWNTAPEYRVLYSNLSDRDGGSIIESLQQQNIPYKFSEGGGALLIPSDKVHEVRLRLATLGLPKGGNVGFELMENQKFGISQFLEQVNYQRSLEGELARSMQTLGSVQSARVHLAIPKPTVFVKEQQKPTASVVLTLHPGRVLDPGQVNAIVHLISSSIPNMPANNVSVIDQQGTLLSSIREAAETMDAAQLKYVRQLEQDYIKRIEDILAPLIGAQNVHAQVTADLDFSQTEQTAETFRPNQPPNQASIRSVQTAESRNGASNPTGVPGALSNQPPVPATAPIVAPASAVIAGAGENASSHKEATTNYEVDRTIRHSKLAVGSIRRLSVAVIINNRSAKDAKGKTFSKPFTPAEQAQLNTLIRNAVGFNAQRGDSVNLLNSAFTDAPAEPELPLWKQPEMIALSKELLKYLLFALVGMYLFFGVIRPVIRKYFPTPAPASAESELQLAKENIKEKVKEFALKAPDASYEGSLKAAKQMATENPQIVASVVRDWVNA